MTGYATRKKLRTALHPDISGDIPRTSDLLGHKFARDDVMPDSLNGPNSFGLPAPIEDPHDLEGRKWARRAIVTLCLIAFVMVFMPDRIRQKLNAWAGTPTATQPARHAAASHLCQNDWNERCLVCLHRDATGQLVKSTHC